jgi:hypothetical protein
MKVRRVCFLLLGLAFVLPLALFAVAHADDDHDRLGPYRLIATVPIPGNLSGGFDISWVDSEAGRYYLADRGSKSIDVIDTKHNKFLYAIPLRAAGNGVVAIRKSDDDEGDSEGAGELWVGDANSFVEVVDLKTKSIVADIPTHGNSRADELAYDPRDGLLLVANDRDTPSPFVTLISTKTRTVVGGFKYDGTFGNPNTTNGIEQPVWDRRTKKFYIAIPATVANPKGEVDEIDPLARMGNGKVTRVFPTNCSGPAGLALVPGQRLVTSCGDIISVASGLVLKTVAGAGGDEIWFNPGDERVYFGGGLDRISVPVLDTDTNSLVTTLTVGHLFPPTPPPQTPPNQTTHSVAADSENNRIFVPVGNVGVKVYTDQDQEGHGDE